MMMNISIIIAISVVMVFFTSTGVFATSLDENDIPDRYKDLPGSHECWIDGYNDGVTDSWDRDRNFECYKITGGFDVYRTALQEGCYDGGYPEEYCLEILH